ncbi:MAG: pilin [Patescibacteria group bacterium]|jgi:hypothetical protein
MKKIILTIAISLLFLSLANFSFAQYTQDTNSKLDSKTGLKPPVLQITIPDLSFSNDKGLWIGEYIQAVYNYGIGIVGILAAIILMWGGLLWLTAGGDQGKVTEAKAWIAAAVTGLVIALSSWTILYIINPNLVSFKSLSEYIKNVEKVEVDLNTYSCDWKKKEAGTTVGSCPIGYYIGSNCDPNDSRHSQLVGIGAPGVSTSYKQINDDYVCCCLSANVDAIIGPLDGGELTNNQGKAMLGDKIQIKNGANLYGIREDTIIGLNEIARIFELIELGDIFITSGTDGEHTTGEYSHSNGYKVDLRNNNNLRQAIENEPNATKGKVDNYPAYYMNFTSEEDDTIRYYYRFLDEGDHWDVRITPRQITP